MSSLRPMKLGGFIGNFDPGSISTSENIDAERSDVNWWRSYYSWAVEVWKRTQHDCNPGYQAKNTMAYYQERIQSYCKLPVLGQGCDWNKWVNYIPLVIVLGLVNIDLSQLLPWLLLDILAGFNYSSVTIFFFRILNIVIYSGTFWNLNKKFTASTDIFQSWGNPVWVVSWKQEISRA